jgi:FixJ family two-component response regulator
MTEMCGWICRTTESACSGLLISHYTSGELDFQRLAVPALHACYRQIARFRTPDVLWTTDTRQWPIRRQLGLGSEFFLVPTVFFHVRLTTRLDVGDHADLHYTSRALHCVGFAMDSPDHIVFIVDDDRRIGEALSALLSSFDMHAVTFGSAAEYMAYPKPDVPACLILDVQLPDINGLELQGQITHYSERGHCPHIVFITGHGDIPSSVRAIKAGAIDFLTKPFQQSDLMNAINSALAHNREARRHRAQLSELRYRLSSLTPREREVLPLLVSGFLNKQIAASLGISEITTQIHRGKVMQKMQAGSFAELIRMAGMLAIPIDHSRTRKHHRHLL